MYRFTIILMFLCGAYQSKCQTSFTKKVWSSFYELIALPANQQVKGFNDLRNQCIQRNLTTDSTYTNLLFLLGSAHFFNSNIEQAVQLLDEAINISEKYPRGTPTPYLSKYYFYLGYYQIQDGIID